MASPPRLSFDPGIDRASGCAWSNVPAFDSGLDLRAFANRAFAGAPWSGYVSPLHVVTSQNVEFDGGPKNSFDPNNGYRDQYKKIWGK